jgi:DNA-directed RNA polymerase specialized sigma24 family protein
MTAPAAPRKFARMDHEQALRELPDVYAAALRLRDAGLDEAAIATRLEMPLEGVPSLLQIAAAKLAAVLSEDQPADGSP